MQGPTCLMSSLQSASVDARWWVTASNSFSGANGFDSLDVLVFVTSSPVLIVSREFEIDIRNVCHIHGLMFATPKQPREKLCPLL
jgi:hypothetical protein